jgi:hypothetical protein
MIVDELAARCDWVRDFCKTAHLIQAPFPICPRTENGEPAKIWAEDRIPRGLRPKSADAPFLSGRWLKAPYERTVVFGNDVAECGAIFVQREPREWIDTKRGSWLGPPWDGMDDVLASHYVMLGTSGNLVWTRVVLSRCDDTVCFSRPEDAVVRIAKICATTPEHEPLDVTSRDRWLAHVWMTLNAGATVITEKREVSPPLDRECTDQQLRTSVYPAYFLLLSVTMAVVTTFSLLHCRNVRQEPVEPAPTVRTKKDRWRNQPLYRYHVLTVAPFAPKGQRTATHLHSGRSVGIHWVRGHFKEYTTTVRLRIFKSPVAYVIPGSYE